MIFKVNWEKASEQYQLQEKAIVRMVEQAFPSKELVSYEIIAGGCVNINIKIILAHEKSPFIIRVYLRDKEASYREKKLGELLKTTVPVPQTFYIGASDAYRFAVVEFMPGMPLRDLLLSDVSYDIVAVMHEVGIVLGNIAAHTFSTSGFFDKDLNSVESLDQSLLNYAKSCLQNSVVVSQLNAQVVERIDSLFDSYGYLFADIETQHNLVHGDFDPANIFVRNNNGIWQVSAVLDWEFAFSGSFLWDIANMLRYAHKMPAEFQDAFIKGCVGSGIVLPKNWQILVCLLNIISLLDCLKRSDYLSFPIDVQILANY